MSYPPDPRNPSRAPSWIAAARKRRLEEFQAKRARERSLRQIPDAGKAAPPAREQMTPWPVWMRLPTLCEYIDLSPSTVRGLVQRGRIPHTRQEGMVFFNRIEIDVWLNGRRVVATRQRIRVPADDRAAIEGGGSEHAGSREPAAPDDIAANEQARAIVDEALSQIRVLGPQSTEQLVAALMTTGTLTGDVETAQEQLVRVLRGAAIFHEEVPDEPTPATGIARGAEAKSKEQRETLVAAATAVIRTRGPSTISQIADVLRTAGVLQGDIYVERSRLGQCLVQSPHFRKVVAVGKRRPANAPGNGPLWEIVEAESDERPVSLP